MRVELLEIPEFSLPSNAIWEVRLLAVNGTSPALDALLGWQSRNRADYKRILKAIRIAAQHNRVTGVRRHVGKCQNPNHSDVYEFIAHTGKARLMFFYDSRSIIICTNAHMKGNSASQDAAFARCAEYRKIYQEYYESQ